MNELLDKADSYLNQHKISFTRLFVISNLNDKSKETNHVLVISGSNLLILSKRLASNNLTESYSFSFFNLTAILLSIENTMILRFASKEIKFQIENPQELVNTILDHIHRILTPHEFSKISYIKPTISLPQPTSHSILFRLNTQLNMHKVEINEKNLKSFTNRFFTHSNSISLNKFKSMDKFLPLFFPCLSMSPFINELEIDTSSIPNIFSIMLQQIESFDRISHIKISSTENEEILKFIKRAKNVNSISFQNCKIKDITNLNSLIQRKYITSVGFDSSIDIETLHMLLNISSFEKLKYFRVSHLKIDFGFCIQKFKHLYQISLTYCNLMVGNVLDLISSNNLPNLRKIDLSGNIGNGFTNPDPKLPANLSTIFVDDIEWKSSQLLYFFEICSDRISILSMNKTKCDNWNEFYENLSNQMNLLKSLKTLSWNENQFHESFVNYIKILPKLKELSVCKCSDINSIINIAIGNKIQSLNIKEMKTENIKSFIERIPDMKSLKQIDISFNSIDDESFTLLADSVFNSEIEFISFDGSKISSHNSLIYFAKKLATRELPLKISYPLNDFGRFKLTKLELSDLIALFDNLRRSLSKRSSVSRKYIPDINFLELDQKFPQFMTHKDISQAERRKHSHHVSDDETPPQNYHYIKRYHQTMPNLHDGLTPQEKTSKKENHENEKTKVSMIVDQQNPTPKIHKKSPSPLKHHHRNKQHENENEIVSVENAENDFPNVIESKRSQTQSEVKKRRKVSPKDDFKIERVPQTQRPMKKRRSKSVIRETRNKPFLNVEMIFEDIKRPKKRHWTPRQKTQWKHFEIPKPPQIDNTLIIMNYNNDFSLHKLMKQVVKE